VTFAFGPDRRLRKHAEFERAQNDRATRRVTSGHFVFLIAPRRNLGDAAGTVPPAPSGPARLGLVVGRKVGNAVRRNRVKRLCRECFRGLPQLLPDGVELIVIARAGAPELGLEEVRAEWLAVERLLKKRAAEALARAGDAHHLGSGPAKASR